MAVTWPRSLGVPLKETRAGTIVSIIISLISIGALSICLSRRVQDVRIWTKLPLVCWLVLLIYADSIFFVAGTAVLSNGFGVDSSKDMCGRAIILCLACYMTTKLIYYFLVERAYIIRKTSRPRMKSRLYLFNSFGMLIPYCVVIVLNFYFRFAIYEDGSCQIGMKRVAMIPLIAFDILVNVYLTSLFLLPLRSLYSYRNNPSSQTRTVALRTFIGSCCTLASSVVNLTVLLVLNGEPGWICLMCCNVDILFSVLVLHWITSKDNASTSPPHPHNSLTHLSHPRSLLSQASQHPLSPHPLSARTRPLVTTHITTSSPQSSSSSSDPDKIGKIGIRAYPANAITVSRDLVRNVDDIGVFREDIGVYNEGGEKERARTEREKGGNRSGRSGSEGSCDDGIGMQQGKGSEEGLFGGY